MLCALTVSPQTLENRLFSEGLHVLGSPPSPHHMASYLLAYFDGALPTEVVEAVAAAPAGQVSASAGCAAQDVLRVPAWTSAVQQRAHGCRFAARMC